MHASRRLAFVSALALAGGLVLSGCQSTPPAASLKQGAYAADSIQSAAAAVQSARAQVNVTTAALRNLVDRPQDIPAQYKIALAQITKLQADATRISASADTMRAKGDAYLADWARQVAAIGDAELRNAAFERRAEVSVKLQEIFKSYQSAKAAYAPYVANLADIQKALGADLSAKGLEAVKPFVAKASANAEPLKAALDQLAAEFRAVGLSLQPGGL